MPSVSIFKVPVKPPIFTVPDKLDTLVSETVLAKANAHKTEAVQPATTLMYMLRVPASVKVTPVPTFA